VPRSRPRGNVPGVRIIVVGGGVLGTLHAWLAMRRGHEVVQLDRELAARGASVRNFGLIWVSGRSDGVELDTALRGRELWAQLGAEVPDVRYRECGSITVVRTDAEQAVAKAAVASDSALRRGLELLDASEVRAANPALRGSLIGGLRCTNDGAVEPRAAQSAIRTALLARSGYRWLPGREVRKVKAGAVRDDHGVRHEGDVVLLCTGAALGGLVRELAPELPVHRVRLQMMQTAPLGEPLTTAVADADSFRYYPAYRRDALMAAQPQQAIAAEHAMQLLMVQRADGGLTIGDTHSYGEPFDFDVAEEPYEHLAGVAADLLGRELPPIRRRWAGVYAQTTNTGRIVHREQVAPGVWLVTGPGGRGMTCAPAIAEQTLDEVGA
jgi:FAD dependent oxidoreductase TIGR03364